MREIKFRAWAGNREIQVADIDFVNGKAYGLGFDIQEAEDMAICKIDTVEQYTGLKDKNGKEIYEGDILAGVLGTAGRGAITRKEKPFTFQLVWARSCWNISAVSRYENSSYRWYPSFSECEVIGNIHENPELL